MFEVVHRDSLVNGTLIGLGTGLASAIGFVRYNCGPPGYDDECTVIATVVSAAFLPVGAGLGALTDFLITKTTYRRPGSPTLALAPIPGRGRRGMMMTVRF